MPMMLAGGQAAMPLDRVVPYFRAVMPGVAGVVLASAGGEALAHDVTAGDADGLAERAVRLHQEACGAAPLADRANGASIFVPHEGGLVLVVFLAKESLADATPPALAVAA